MDANPGYAERQAFADSGDLRGFHGRIAPALYVTTSAYISWKGRRAKMLRSFAFHRRGFNRLVRFSLPFYFSQRRSISQDRKIHSIFGVGTLRWQAFGSQIGPRQNSFRRIFDYTFIE